MLGPGVLQMGPCKNCQRGNRSGDRRIATGEEQCIECLRRGKWWNLAPLSIAKWGRLEERKQKTRAAAIAASESHTRFLKEVAQIEREQSEMVESELKNVEELEAEEAPMARDIESSVAAGVTMSSDEPIVDPSLWAEWPTIEFPEIGETPSGVSGSS